MAFDEFSPTRLTRGHTFLLRKQIKRNGNRRHLVCLMEFHASFVVNVHKYLTKILWNK